MPQNSFALGWFILPVLLALSPADSKSVLGGEPGGAARVPAGRPFRLDYVNVKRSYMFFGPDPKIDKTLFNPKEEHLKPGKFEISVSRAYYAHKAVMTVEAPDAVEDGQSVTIKATADATWDLAPKEPLTSSGLEVGIGGGYGVKGDRKNLSATPKEPFKSGSYRLQAQMSDTVKVSDNLRQFFGGYGPWPPPEKDMEYRSFALTMTTNINGNIGRMDTYWYYKRPKAGKIETKPDQKPGRVDLVVTGGRTAGEALTVTATVPKPGVGQTLKLELPPGLELIAGQPVQKMPLSGAVSWQVKAAQPGRYELKVGSSSGGSTPQTVTIAPPIPAAPTRLVLLLPDQATAGQAFAVTARVTNPLPNQALTLSLAPKLERLEGPEQQPVPSGGGERTVSWKVKGLEPGQFSVRVRSSTGVEQEKSMTISPAKDRYTLLDAQRALKMWVGMIPEEMELDVDGSGHVDSHDAVLILQIAGARLDKQP